MSGLKIFKLKGWFYFTKGTNSKNTKITGKYLFFSKDPFNLIQIVFNEIYLHNFEEAKINTKEELIGEDYVLCLYYENNSREQELRKRYNNSNEIKIPPYKFWKSDEDTLKGIYSKKYKDNLKNS